jgi:hypothetical protein
MLGDGRRGLAQALVCAALLGSAAPLTPLAGQLPPASAAELGIGGRAVASTRGFAAVATNPAGLGMPREERLSVAILPVRSPLEFLNDALGSGLQPISLQDINEYDGEFIPAAVREAWLQRVERAGQQTGREDGSLSALALARGRFGFQLSGLSLVGAHLNPDAAELLLFGNAGRTGEPRSFRLGGSSLDTWVVTTAAVAFGMPLDVQIGDAPEQSFAVGTTLKYSMGNLLYLVRDLGSFVSGDPLEVLLRFPVVHTEVGEDWVNGGGGFGLDLGFQWEGGPWGLGLSVTNLVNTYRWDLDNLFFRPGTVLFTQDQQESDFDPRPASEASDPLVAEVRDFRFGPRLSLGATKRRSERLRLFGQLDVALGRSAAPEPELEAGVAAELQATPRIPIQAHFSVLTGGVRAGGGAGVKLGRVHLSGAGSLVTAGTDVGSIGMLTVSIGGS